MSNYHGSSVTGGEPASPEEAVLYALDLHESGDDDAALALVRRLHADDVESATLALGALLMANDQHAEGVAVFEDAIERDVDGARGAYADCLSEIEGAETDAEFQYRKAIEDGSVDASIGLAELLRTVGRRSEAVELLVAVAEQDIDADQRCDLADILSEIPGQRAETERQYRLAIGAGWTDAIANLSIDLTDWGRAEESADLLESAIVGGAEDLSRRLANTLVGIPGRMSEAESWYRRAIDEGDHHAAIPLASHLHDLDRIEEAKELLRPSAEAGDPEFRGRLILLEAETGDEASASKHFDQWADALPLDDLVDLGAFLRTAEAVELAERVLRRAVAEGDEESANQLGKMLEENGSVEGAVAYYKKELGGGNTSVRINLAELLSRQPSTRNEADALFRAMIGDDVFEAYNNYGLFLREDGNTEEAMHWYREGVARGDAYAMRNLALTLDEIGARDEAVVLMRQAVDHGANDGWVDLCGWAAESGDIEAAEFAAQMALETEAEHVYSNVPFAMEHIWPWERREALMRQGMARGDHMAAFNLGVDLRDRGLNDEAAEAYLIAIELGSVMAMNNLGGLWAEQGRHGEARALLERARELGDGLAADSLSELDAAGADADPSIVDD